MQKELKETLKKTKSLILLCKFGSCLPPSSESDEKYKGGNTEKSQPYYWAIMTMGDGKKFQSVSNR